MRHTVIDEMTSSPAKLEIAAGGRQQYLFDAAAASGLRRAGARRIVSTDSCRHPTNGIQLAGLLAGALREEIAP